MSFLIANRPSSTLRLRPTPVAPTLRHLIQQLDTTDITRRRDRSHAWPALNLVDTGTGYGVQLLVPGVQKENISVQVTSEYLHIEIEPAVDTPDGYEVQYSDRVSRKYTRSIAFPAKVDPEAVSASLKNGVLTISLDKLPELQPRVLDIEVG